VARRIRILRHGEASNHRRIHVAYFAAWLTAGRHVGVTL
jgi:hypothetical protein